MKKSPVSRPSARLPHRTIAFLVFAALLPSAAHAATLYWDTNGATAGAGTTADGIWDIGTTANWSTDAAGASATTTFTAADDVIFSAGTDTTTAAITASGTPSAHSITIEEGSYSFSGNISLSSAANTGSMNVASGASATSANNITLLGNTAFAIEGSLSAHINGAGKTITKTGAGTLTINDAVSSDYTINTNGGLVILQRSNTTKQLKASSINSGGTVRIAANDQFGNNLSVNTGGTLEVSAGVSDNIASLSGAGAITGGSNSTLGLTGGTFSGTVGGDIAITKTGAGTFTFSGTGTSTGNVTVSAGAYTLADAGSLTFSIGANGITNKVTGAGTATFNGTFAFDLANAVLADGNSWTIADVTIQSFAGTFDVAGFSDDDLDNIWTNGAGLSFSEATGILSYSAIPEPSSFALFGGLASLALIGLRRRHA